MFAGYGAASQNNKDRIDPRNTDTIADSNARF